MDIFFIEKSKQPPWFFLIVLQSELKIKTPSLRRVSGDGFSTNLSEDRSQNAVLLLFPSIHSVTLARIDGWTKLLSASNQATTFDSMDFSR